jgi:hypothetical protein
MIAAVRPHAWDFPLFLHVLGAMTLFGTTLAACAAAWLGRTRPILVSAAFWCLIAALPAWALMRGGAAWIYSKEGFGHGAKDPTWITFGFIAAEPGLLILLVAAGLAYWWKRSAKGGVGIAVSGLTSVYLVLLALAWLAMSGKWS